MISTSLPDFVNGVFELLTGIWIIRACQCLYRDKTVKGTSYGLQIWVTAWGFYNLFYYPHLGQWCSFIGGLVTVTFNALWIVMAWYYHRNPGGRRDYSSTHI